MFIKFFISLFLISASLPLSAQTLSKMHWVNEPEKWEVKDKSLTMFVTARTDYWRISHYGFTVDDAPFYYTTYGGEFEVKVKLSGQYKARFDQLGLMIRADHKQWIKAGVEFVDGKLNVSAVVTNEKSDWSVIQLDSIPSFLWIKAVRRLDAIEFYYSLDDRKYIMMRNAPFPDHQPVMVGLMAASPDGEGFHARFEHFTVRHLPDARRLEWLKKNEGK